MPEGELPMSVKRGLVILSLSLATGVWTGAVAAQQPATEAPGSRTLVQPGAVLPGESVRIDLVVERSATSATGARAAAELAARRVVRAVAGLGLDIREVRVAGTTLRPEWEVEGPLRVNTIRQPPRPVGYRAYTAITVRTPDVDRVGLLVDMARGAGATPLRAAVEIDPVPAGMR
jgi:uncharacterized protein YggE